MPSQVTQWHHQHPVTDPLKQGARTKTWANKTHQDEGNLQKERNKTTTKNNKTGKGKEEDSSICRIEKQSPRDARLLPTFGSAGSMLSVLTLKINFAIACFTLVFWLNYFSQEDKNQRKLLFPVTIPYLGYCPAMSNQSLDNCPFLPQLISLRITLFAKTFSYFLWMQRYLWQRYLESASCMK